MAKLTLSDKFNKLKLTLTPEQQEHYKSIEWLYGEARRSGRTVLLAVIIIEHAMENLNQPIYMIDHYRQLPHRNALYDTVCCLLNDNDMWKSFKIDGRNNTLTYIGSEELENGKT